MLLTTVYLVVLAIMFSSGAGVEIFGQNLYLVKTESFDLIKPPSAVFGEKTETVEVGLGDIIIFNHPDEYKLIGEIVAKEEVSYVDDSGIFFTVRTEFDEKIAIREDSVIAKAVRTSRLLGIIISFAVSPVGVLVIAVIPCIAIILWELFRPIFKKKQDEKEVAPVNKQTETPTFVPPEPAEPEKPLKSPPVAHFELDAPTPELEKPTSPAAALKAYKQTLALDESGSDLNRLQLFVKPEVKSEPAKPIQARVIENTPAQPPKKKPLSSVKLAEVIATVNAQKIKEEIRYDNPT
jgi:hypothetical protein